MYITRRRILASGLGAGLAAGLPGAPLARNDGLRTIPSDRRPIPAVGMGTWITFNVGSDPALLARSVDVMREFFAEGGGMIDSSPMYGSSQNTVGHGLSALGYPDTLFSAEKVWTRSVPGGPSQIAETAGKWGVGRFDLMQVHNLLGVEGHLDNLFARKAAGQLGYVGITTSHGRRHGDVEDLMRRHPLDFVQLTYNVLDRRAERQLLPLAQERGIGVIVNRPFRRGGLIARTAGAPLPGFAADLGARTWADLMLKFVLSHPAVTVAIPATTSVQHVRENKAAGAGPMPDDDLRRRISRAVAEL